MSVLDVYVCCIERYEHYQTDDCWKTTTIEHIYASLDKAKAWVNGKRTYTKWAEIARAKEPIDGEKMIRENWMDGDYYEVEIVNVSLETQPITRYEYYQYSMRVEL